MAPARMGTGGALHLTAAIKTIRQQTAWRREVQHKLSCAVFHGANNRLCTRYDELHMNAVVNWTKSLKSDGTALGGVPSLFGTSLQVRPVVPASSGFTVHIPKCGSCMATLVFLQLYQLSVSCLCQ